MSVLSGVFGALSGLWSNSQNNKRQQKALDYEAAQNKLQRQWSEKMYEKQRDDARYDAARERAYNSPLAQRQRLQAAGLNPDLMYGNGASGLVDSVMPSYGSVNTSGGTSTAGVSAIAGTPTMADSMLQGIAGMKMLAETDDIRTDIKKKQGELTSIDLDNFVKAATQGSQIEMAGLNVQLSKSALSLNEAQRQNLVQTLTNLQTQNELCNQQIQQSIAQVRNLDSSTLNNRISAMLATPRFENECRQLTQNLKESDARISLTTAQAKEILTLLLAKKLNLDADALLKRANVRKTNFEAANAVRTGNILNVQGKQLQFNYEQSTEYGDAERVAGIIGSALGSVSNVVGMFTKVR